MTTDLRKRLEELKRVEKSCLNELWSVAYPGWEKHYIILEGEKPWWEISDPQERRRASGRQERRLWRKNHLEQVNSYNLKAMLKWGLTQVYTTKTPSGKPGCIPAPHKRKCPDACELCGKEFKRLGWHHWIALNPSVGIWVCNLCHQFAETVDRHLLGLNERYVSLKASLSNIYSKRCRPEDDLCELCGVIKCKDYHHWDDLVPGRGLWLCRKCHAFAERYDIYGEVLIAKYLSLKNKDELRVLALDEAA